MSEKQHAYLTMVTGQHAGKNFTLDPASETRIGRGPDCSITLVDPLASRVHATIARDAGHWVVRDASSRNGTQVNGQKIFEAALGDGHSIRIGRTEFVFRLSQEPITTTDEEGLTQTIVQDAPVGDDSQSEIPSAIPSAQQVEEMMLLYQLSIRLLGLETPEAVVHAALDLLHERTKAAVVGFLAVTDEGELQPKLVIPEEATPRVTLNASLTAMVLKQGRAVWVANQQRGGVEHGGQYADAVCAPLVRRGPEGKRQTLGAIHVYLADGRFRQSDFDFAISVANIVAVALARARHVSALESDYRRLIGQEPGYEELIGESDKMRRLKSKIARVARAAGCVLVRGESGVGKELVARAIHRASPRADAPLVAVNCAAIPRDLMESQLFGHKSGAFTGADRDHAGYFQQADMGTLFLDEVGELTLEGQAKLLRILEGHPFLPVGATKEIRVDVRVIAATNRDLAAQVREKTFREDLFYRLSVFELIVPPLREREDDIGLLIDFFLAHYAKQHSRPGLRLSPAAREKLLRYRWPGNVRQLRNVIDSAVVLAEDNVIQPADLGLRDTGGEALDSLRIDDWERRLIPEALRRTGGNVPEAANLLGISRATLYRKMDQYNIRR